LQRVQQNLEEIIARLSRIEAVWKDDVAGEIEAEINYLRKLLKKGKPFSEELVELLLKKKFDIYLTIFRLFLELSKDEFEGSLRESLPNGMGIKAFREDSKPLVNFLIGEGLIETVNEYLSRRWSWHDVIMERLKLGRGSAIKGQKRGRYLEDAVEAVVKAVFGTKYDKGCNFVGMHNRIAKAEFAIPDKKNPSIIFEVKAYGATGSKQTDVIGDIEKIIGVKKPFTEFLFVTDGVSWKRRMSDLRKIIAYQNDGDIKKIYTLSMLSELKEDLLVLKKEHNL